MYDIYICIHTTTLPASISFKTTRYKALFRKQARFRKRALDSAKEPYNEPYISAVLIRYMATPYRGFVRCQTVHVDIAAVSIDLLLCCAARSRKNPATTRPTPMCLGFRVRV